MLLDEIKKELPDSYTKEIIGATVTTTSLLAFAAILGIILAVVFKMRPKAASILKVTNFGLDNVVYGGKYMFFVTKNNNYDESRNTFLFLYFFL